jgi:bacterioferritin (cytochrome b1)
VNRDRFEIVEELNRLMAEEAESSLRYFQMRFRVADPPGSAVQTFLETALAETLEHADALAKQIHALGHAPTLRIHLDLGGGAMRAEDALAEALEVEQAALDAYKDFLPRVIGDPVLEPFIRQQIATETEHVGEIREIVRTGAGALRLVTKAGAPVKDPQ